jgi:uncharacterized short protein YbdD (DUF466 family)
MAFVIAQRSRTNYSFKAMAGFKKYRNYFWQEGKHPGRPPAALAKNTIYCLHALSSMPHVTD